MGGVVFCASGPHCTCECSAATPGELYEPGAALFSFLGRVSFFLWPFCCYIFALLLLYFCFIAAVFLLCFCFAIALLLFALYFCVVFYRVFRVEISGRSLREQVDIFVFADSLVCRFVVAVFFVEWERVPGRLVELAANE